MKSSVNGIATSQCHVPSCAVVFYTADGKNQNSSYATYHAVREAGQKFELGPGTSLTTKNLLKLAEQAAKGLKHATEILPPNVLVANDKLLVWWTPASQQFMSFDISMHSELPGRKRLQGVSGMVPVPALVFALRRDRVHGGALLGMQIHALADNSRPEPGTKLFRAPLMNVNDQGSVCWGDGRKPKGRAVTDISAWQSLFFSSVFTHYNGSKPIKCDDPYAFVADLIETKAKEFPLTSLVPSHQTLQRVVEILSGDNYG